MSLKGRGLFFKLINKGHLLADMGLKGKPGDVMRLSARVGVAKAFRGVTLDGIEPSTTRGYGALMRVFLTHSALEQYLELTRQKLGEIEAAHESRQAATVVSEIFAEDSDGKFFDFVHPKLNRFLQPKLIECREGKCCNVGIVSGSIRHIFAHGYFTANANDMKPARICRICQIVSTFIIEYIDDDFFTRMREFARGKKL